MTVHHLTLVRHAPTTAVRVAAFGADEPLDRQGREAARRAAEMLPDGARALVSPARRARETAAALGLDAPRVMPALAECDFGRWAGRTLLDVHAEDPVATARWMADPDSAPHGGESLAALVTRVAAWLEDQATMGGTSIAVTHGGVVKAAVVVALGAPLQAFWSVEVAPLSRTDLRADDGRWTLGCVNTTLDGRMWPPAG